MAFPLSGFPWKHGESARKVYQIIPFAREVSIHFKNYNVM